MDEHRLECDFGATGQHAAECATRIECASRRSCCSNLAAQQDRLLAEAWLVAAVGRDLFDTYRAGFADAVEKVIEVTTTAWVQHPGADWDEAVVALQAAIDAIAPPVAPDRPAESREPETSAEHHPDCPAGDGSMFCLCQALRAAEHRLWTGPRGIARLKAALDNGREIGWTAAVGRMREAVAAMEDIEPATHEGEPQGVDSPWVLVRRSDVLALLDGLPGSAASTTLPATASPCDAASDTVEGTP